jgi:hypothetical protein
MFEAMERFEAAILATRSSINLVLDRIVENVLFQNILLKKCPERVHLFGNSFHTAHHDKPISNLET